MYKGAPTKEILNSISSIPYKEIQNIIEFLTLRKTVHAETCCFVTSEVDVRRSQGACAELGFLIDIFTNFEDHKEQLKQLDIKIKAEKELSIGSY